MGDHAVPDVTTPLSVGDARSQRQHDVLTECIEALAIERPQGDARRVLVTGFGPFPPHETNASAAIVAALIGAPLRAMPPPDPTDVVDPSPHLQRFVRSMTFASGEVEVHALVLPVAWDLAALLTLRHLAVIRPVVVVMNGIGHAQQPIGVERAATGLSSGRPDALGMRHEQELHGKGLLVDEDVGGRRPLSLARESIVARARAALERSSLRARSIELAAARDDNAFICNQLAYLVDRASKRGRELLALRTDHARGVTASVEHPVLGPLGFVHWPSSLAGDDIFAAADVLRAIVDAALDEVT